MKNIQLLILCFTLIMISCSESITTTVAKQACQCIENDNAKDARVCTREAIKNNKEILENEYKKQGIAVLDENKEVNPFYFQLIYMTMLQSECPEISSGK